MDGAMFSKSLIQFSIDGWGCVPSLLFDLRLKYGGGNEDNGDSFKRSHAYTASLSAPDPSASHHQPTPGHSWASLGQSLVGSLILSPGYWYTQGSVSALQESVSPVLCKFWQLYDGLMATSSKRAYAIPRSTAPRAPAHTAVHYWPMPPQETPKHSSFSVSVGYLGPGVQKVCLSSLRVSG